MSEITASENCAAVNALVKNCPRMRVAIQKCGVPRPIHPNPGFDGLCRIIIDQQVSKAAGASIWKKFEEGLGGKIMPHKVLYHTPEALKGFGLSNNKVHYIIGLANAIASKKLNLDLLITKSDKEVIDALTQVKGIGMWSAQIYLLFGLGRPDVFPSGDLALRIASQKLIKLACRPSIDEMCHISESWQPFRSTAAQILWLYYKNMT